jgi:hypothetical protein
LAHPKPQLVRGAAEVARPALAAKPLTTSTYCLTASRLTYAAGHRRASRRGWPSLANGQHGSRSANLLCSLQ